MTQTRLVSPAGRGVRQIKGFEIASYELLECVARIAGDDATAELARRNRADEEAMVEKIEASWDKVVSESLQHEGVTAGVR